MIPIGQSELLTLLSPKDILSVKCTCDMLCLAVQDLEDNDLWKKRLTSCLGLQTQEVGSWRQMCLDITFPINYYWLGKKYRDLGLQLLGISSIQEYDCSEPLILGYLARLCYSTKEGEELLKSNPTFEGFGGDGPSISVNNKDPR
jgi:hypothetical protein